MKLGLTLAGICLAASVLTGCPDGSSPKKPPGIPEPKASAIEVPAGVALALNLPRDTSGQDAS